MSSTALETVADDFAALKTENPVAYLEAVIKGVDIDRTLAFAEYAEQIFGRMELDAAEFNCVMKTAPRRS